MDNATIRVEFGAWVDGTVAKRDGKGMQKVWVSDPAGERISVIVTRDNRERVALTMHATEETFEILLAAAQALDTRSHAKPAPAQKAPAAPKAAPKPPTPPTPAKPALASLPKPAPATGRVSSLVSARVVTPAPAPVAQDAGQDLLDWLDAVRA